MGPANLKAIKHAAKKLERLDPEYAERMSFNREAQSRKRSLARVAALKIEDQSLKNVTATVDPIGYDPEQDVTSVSEQDSALLILAANDNGTVGEPITHCTDVKFYTHAGKTMTLAQWSIELGIPQSTIRARIYNGHTVSNALAGRLLHRGAEPRIQRAKRYEHNGKSKTIAEWSQATGISEQTLRTRLKARWPLEKALSVGVGKIMGSASHRKMTGGWVQTSKNDARTSLGGPRDSLPNQDFFQ